MKKKSIVITDGIDLSTKAGVTRDEFYTANVGKSIIADCSTVNSMGVITDSQQEDSEKEYFALISTSDKTINSRRYAYDGWKKTVEDGSWVKPYQKPILYNHDLYSAMPSGRIVDTFFVDHNSKTVTASTFDNELPKEVLDFYESIGAFEDGTGTIIGKFVPSKALKSRIDGGLDVTVSQSSTADSFVCNVCGNDYFSADCEHVAGREYELEDGKKLDCVVTCDGFDPIEFSFVNRPANDTSVVFTLDKKKCKKGKCKDEEEVKGKIKDNKKEVVQEPIEEPIKDEKEVKTNSLLKDLAKKYVCEKMHIKDEKKDEIEELLKVFDEDQIEALIKLSDAVEIEVQVSDETEKAAAPTVTLDDPESIEEEPEQVKDEEPQAEPESEPEAEPEVPVEEETPAEEPEATEPEIEPESEPEEEPEVEDKATDDLEDLPQNKVFTDSQEKVTVDYCPEIASIVNSYIK